ncbi:MAG: addiction module antidote protein, HigA family [Deltaproteobacteria bacterium HGW-Deltaproteobacteria-13]|jgi:HTH-type transcriptional regulator/antitoxin HigA|nr:MAG: addiction module antidote protein, HigA family [Deltaproteobacteria bacterium HGW-Deltaproteobacteria-13]
MAYIPNKAVHPGHTIAKALEREGMPQKNLCARTGLSEKHLSQIINGSASITVETALLLENALGGSASFWINLEKNYQETNARLERMSLVKKEISLVPKFFYNELAKRGYVPQTSSNENKVENLWRFFGVNSLSYIENTEPVVYRKKNGVEVKKDGIAAWLRCGEIESKKVTLPEYSDKKLKQSLPKIKLLSVKNPEEYSKEIRDILNTCGVYLVYIPHFPGIGVSGAVRWINNNPLIQLSIYNAWADIFWFTLYHEIGHLILHGKKEKFIEYDDRDLVTAKEKENEADRFASDELIPEKSYTDFLKKPLSFQGIIEFANSFGIHSGIVAGRLCHDGKVNWNKVSTLRSRLKFADE